MNKPAPRFRPISGPLDVSDDALDKIGDELGVPILSKPEQPPAPRPLMASDPSTPNPVRVTARVVSNDPPQAALLPVEERATAALEKISLELPDYLAKAMRMRVAEEGTTLRYLVMQGLRSIRFTIDDCDFVTDGRSFRAKPR